MYPTLFRIGSFEITSFGVMVGIGALVGLWIFRRELAARHLPEAAADAAIAGVVGGLLGAKLLWVFEHVHEAPLTELLISRAGLSWFGGLAGGVGTALLLLARRGDRLLPIIAAATPALAAGHAIGRIGCFLVGDDYGRPTNLPWGVAFPEGSPPTTARVHPTQIYEAIALAALTAALVRWRRAGLSSRQLVARYLVIAGAIRFAIEFIRINDRVLFGLTVAQLASLGMMAAGVGLILAPGAADRPRTRQ